MIAKTHALDHSWGDAFGIHDCFVGREVSMAVFIGSDWSSTKYDVCVLNEDGMQLATLVLPHSADGLLKLETERNQLSVAPYDCLVGSETVHSLVIESLWARAYTYVYVIHPSMVK